MTAAQYLAAHPDLQNNWNRAHDAAWVAANPGSADVVAMVLRYPTITDYLRVSYGHAFDGEASSSNQVGPLGTSTQSNNWVWWAAAAGGLYLAWKKGWLKF